MKRLTNRQMEILSEAVVNALQEKHEEATKALREGDEYKNFEKSYTDDFIVKSKKYLEHIKDLTDELDKAQEAYAQFARTAFPTGYLNTRPSGIETLINAYLEKRKRELYPQALFNREKMLTTIQADILLSDVGDPKELVASLVDKFTKEN